MSRISAFLSAKPGDQFRLLIASALLLSLPFIFPIGSFARIRRVMLRVSERGEWIVQGTPKYSRVVLAVKVADSQLPGSRTCLVRSSTAEVLLRLYGFTPEHRIGVAKEDSGEISAHSWLKLDGEVIIGELDDLPRFDPLPSLDATEVV